jgi:hypothetical protein
MLTIIPIRRPTANAITMGPTILPELISSSWKKRIFIKSKDTAIAVTKPYSGPQREEEIGSAKRDTIRVKNAERMRDTSFLLMSYTYTAFYGIPLFKSLICITMEAYRQVGNTIRPTKNNCEKGNQLHVGETGRYLFKAS